jgi:glyoxylase-like metal-dependent hydrolase (beta-lactamase superfamily II)
MSLKIYPILTGYLNVEKSLLLTPNQNYGEMVLLPSMAYLLIDQGRKIMVDTGMPDSACAHKHRPGSYQAPEHQLTAQLGKLGLGPEDVDDVILTHLHWDHCANLGLFTQARFYVQRAELDFALNPHPLLYRVYNAPALGFAPPFAHIHFHLLDGGYGLNERIVIVPTAGHSAGHQSVVVKGKDGNWVLSGDAVCNEQTFVKNGHLPFFPTGPFVDAIARYNSVNDIIALAGGKLERIMSPHSPRALQQEYYALA